MYSRVWLLKEIEYSLESVAQLNTIAEQQAKELTAVKVSSWYNQYASCYTNVCRLVVDSIKSLKCCVYVDCSFSVLL